MKRLEERVIIDAHAHLWHEQRAVVEGKRIEALPNGRAFFMGEEKQMLPPFMIDGRNTAEILLSNMDYARVSGAVITQEFIDGLQNDYLRSVVAAYPDRFRCCAFVDYRRPGWLAEAIRLIDEPCFAGIALPAHRLDNDIDGHFDFRAPDARTLFAELVARGKFLSLCLPDNPHQIGAADEAFTDFPDLHVAIGHFGLARSAHWADQLRLARHPHVVIESGGITWLYNDEFYPFTGAVKAIRSAADTVGVDKLLWGSDYPRTITAITYRMSYDFLLRTDAFTEDELRAFLGGNAQRFYGFGPLAVPPSVKNMSED